MWVKIIGYSCPKCEWKSILSFRFRWNTQRIMLSNYHSCFQFVMKFAKCSSVTMICTGWGIEQITSSLSSLALCFLGSWRNSLVKRRHSWIFSGNVKSKATFVHDCKVWHMVIKATEAIKRFEKINCMC